MEVNLPQPPGFAAELGVSLNKSQPFESCPQPGSVSLGNGLEAGPCFEEETLPVVRLFDLPPHFAWDEPAIVIEIHLLDLLHVYTNPAAGNGHAECEAARMGETEVDGPLASEIGAPVLIGEQAVEGITPKTHILHAAPEEKQAEDLSLSIVFSPESKDRGLKPLRQGSEETVQCRVILKIPFGDLCGLQDELIPNVVIRPVGQGCYFSWNSGRTSETRTIRIPMMGVRSIEAKR